MALLDRIKFDGLKSRDWLIYKYPSEGLATSSVLIVNEGQVAIFVKGGEVCDIFTAGSYVLETQNIPILSGLINLPFGGDTPFSAEIYFINITTKLDVTWGTSDPIQLIDPKYFIKLRVRAFGQMGLKIKDYELFFKELIGGMNQNDLVKFDIVKLFYRGLVITKVKTIIADIIINNKISALEISTKLEEISEKVHEELIAEIGDYGMHIPVFFIESINLPDEDLERLDEILHDKAEFEIMGDQRYATKRSFDVYEGAATNQSGVAGAMLAGGVGLGAGVNMFHNMNNNTNPVDNGNTISCPSCNQLIPANHKFCNNCGVSLEIKTIKCHSCNTENNAGAKFCNNCGTSLLSKICECGNELSPGSKFCSACGKKAD